MAVTTYEYRGLGELILPSFVCEDEDGEHSTLVLEPGDFVSLNVKVKHPDLVQSTKTKAGGSLKVAHSVVESEAPEVEEPEPDEPDPGEPEKDDA